MEKHNSARGISRDVGEERGGLDKGFIKSKCNLLAESWDSGYLSSSRPRCHFGILLCVLGQPDGRAAVVSVVGPTRALCV